MTPLCHDVGELVICFVQTAIQALHTHGIVTPALTKARVDVLSFLAEKVTYFEDVVKPFRDVKLVSFSLEPGAANLGRHTYLNFSFAREPKDCGKLTWASWGSLTVCGATMSAVHPFLKLTYERRLLRTAEVGRPQSKAQHFTCIARESPSSILAAMCLDYEEVSQ